MFLVGLLSSIIPYIATIGLMCVYMLVGEPTKEQLNHFMKNEEKIVAHNQHSKRVVSDLETIAHFVASKQTNVFLQEEIILICCQQQTYTLLCPRSNYHFLSSSADGNKAPPRCFI